MLTYGRWSWRGSEEARGDPADASAELDHGHGDRRLPNLQTEAALKYPKYHDEFAARTGA